MHPARLDVVRAAVTGLPLNVEIKNNPADPDFDDSLRFPLEVAALAAPGDLVTSFHRSSIDAIRIEYSDLDTGLLVGVDGSLDEAAGWAEQIGHGVIAPHWWLLGENPQRRVHELTTAGLRVVVWTVNDLDLARRLGEAGVHGIITDDPEGIRRAIEEDR